MRPSAWPGTSRNERDLFDGIAGGACVTLPIVEFVSSDKQSWQAREEAALLHPTGGTLGDGEDRDGYRIK